MFDGTAEFHAIQSSCNSGLWHDWRMVGKEKEIKESWSDTVVMKENTD
jgi:hypothetical protein